MKPYHKNPRKINDKQLNDLRRWLDELGDLSGIVHDMNSDEIIGGNQRTAVLGFSENDITITERLPEPDRQGTIAHGYILWHGARYAYRQVAWTPEQCERANIIANKAGGDWEIDRLLSEFETAVLLDSGFGQDELDDMLAELEKGKVRETADAEPQTSRADELRQEWATETGQLWILPSRTEGQEHRLICGDCTDKAVVERVMGGERAKLFVTDPPYGVDYSSLRTSQAEVRRTTVEYDDIEADKLNGDDLQKFLESVFSNCKDFLDKKAAWYIWHAQMTQGFFAAAAAAAADILIHRQIIWVKPSFIFGRGDYHWKHELCFYGWVKGFRPPFYGERNQDTVWMLGGGGSSGGTHKDHPTQKPLEVYDIPIRNHTQNDEVILDPFSGSGTCIIAAENLSRQCRAIEISPAYVAVALQRYLDAFQIRPYLAP